MCIFGIVSSFDQPTSGSLRASPAVSVEFKFPVELNSFSDFSRNSIVYYSIQVLLASEN